MAPSQGPAGREKAWGPIAPWGSRGPAPHVSAEHCSDSWGRRGRTAGDPPSLGPSGGFASCPPGLARAASLPGSGFCSRHPRLARHPGWVRSGRGTTVPFPPDPALLRDSSRRERTRGSGPDLLRTHCVTWAKSLRLSQPQFPHPYSEDIHFCLSKLSCKI